MAFTVQDFRANLTGSGARPNLFDVQLIFPASAPNGNATRLVTFMARASAIPPANLGTIELSYFGRKLKYPGDRTFPEWTLTVVNDENFAIRDAFVRWSDSMNNMEANLRDPAAGTPNGYSTDIIVRQYSKLGGAPIKQYKLIGAWPSSVGDIQLDWSVNDTVEEFPVTLQYQWWDDLSGTTT
jgi:hypothetical protein